MITLVDYDPAWPERFETLRKKYHDAMAAATVPAAVKKRVDARATNIDEYDQEKRDGAKDSGRS